jgi:undecaprenyl-diphosphatase
VIGGGSILLILYLWRVKKDFAGILTVVVAVAGSNVLNKVIKNLMERERPAAALEEDGFSFPSGHAMVGMVFYLTAAYYLSREFSSVKVKWGICILALLITVLTGMSRIVEQAHYPSDVLAGFLIGYSIFTLTTFLYEKRPD